MRNSERHEEALKKGEELDREVGMTERRLSKPSGVKAHSLCGEPREVESEKHRV